MKRLLFVLLMMICPVSWAAWDFVFEDEEIAFYSDKSSIRRTGNISRIWSMMDFHEIQKSQMGVSYKSTKNLFSFDCKSEEGALISGHNFSEPMGSGKNVGSYTTQKIDWEYTPIVPELVKEHLWRIACRKR